jgi:hypothetical protein
VLIEFANQGVLWQKTPDKHMKCVRLIPFAALVAAISCGCSKSTPEPPVRPEALRSEDSVARIRWLGKKRIAADANAAGLMQIWGLNQSKDLEAQTLNKLSTAPWRLLGRGVTNVPSALFRLLLDDLVREESYLEIRHPTNQPAELVFAIHLPSERIGLWETNLATVLESLTSIRPTSRPGERHSWSLQKHHDPDFIEFTQAGDWTILALGPQHNALLETVRARIQNQKVPFIPGPPGANFWVEADLDLARLTNAFSVNWNPPETLPKISIRVRGNSGKVETVGQLNFPRPLALTLDPWNVPTNLISPSLTSFTAIRGGRFWMNSMPIWRDLQMDPPNQLYFWSVPSGPIGSYAAAPSADASNQVSRISDYVLQNGSRWFGSNSMVRFERATKFNGLDWRGPPLALPHLRSVEVDGNGFILAGLFPVALTNRSGSVKVAGEVSARTNLVAYEFEMTGARIEQLLYVSQFARLVLHKSQLPTNAASILWLKTVVPRLAASGSELAKSGPDQLSFMRRSDIGFTASELHLLADWLESPDFPLGLHTTRVILPPRPSGLGTP